jgi:membrane-associated protein
MFLDVNQIVQTGGLLAIAFIIFAETGLLIGFFLPGDTLLIAAGVFAAQGKLPLLVLIPICAVAAFFGYRVGYMIGERAGPRIFKRKDGVLFREEYIKRTEEFLQKHGGKAVLLARFIVVVRTVIPLVAGVGKMSKKKFFVYNLIGSILWTSSIILAAYWLGHKIPNLDKYIIYFVVAAMVLTTGGGFIEIMRSRARRQELMSALREELSYFFKFGKK